LKIARLLSTLLGTGAVLATVGAAAANAAPSQTAHTAAAGSPKVIDAAPFAKVTSFFPTSLGGPLLESPVFGPGGSLYFVDTFAPAGQSKVVKLNMQTKKVTPVYTNSTMVPTSIQFSPADGKAYLTDYASGSIYRMNPNGSGFTTVFSGKVKGRPMAADDIAFNKAGDMYVADSAGTPWDPIGRVVRFSPKATDPIVVQDGLAGANGISFTPDYSGMWIAELTAGREDYFTLAPNGKSYTSGSIGMYGNIGNGAGFDSNAVDAAGNVYQCITGSGEILVWNSHGDLLATVRIPQNMPKPQLLSTNLAIKPGTTQGYITVGGENGGYIYHFRALAKGISQSNGGSKVY
jgi:lactonase